MKRKILLAVACVAVMFTVGQVQAGPLPASGPDAFGYSGNTISNNLRDISSSGTFLPLTDDGWSNNIAFGFDFDFYGTTFSQAIVSPNGYLTFDSGSYGYITGLGDDLNKPQGNIRYQTLGMPGDREFVVGFYEVHRYHTDPLVTFEMILHEGSNDIEFQYGTLNGEGEHATVQMFGNNGQGFLQVYSAGNPTFDNTGYLISTSTMEPTPEPTSLAIFGIGALCFGGAAARRRRKEKLAAEA